MHIHTQHPRLFCPNREHAIIREEINKCPSVIELMMKQFHYSVYMLFFLLTHDNTGFFYHYTK
jgi:hypothetical protein